MSHVVDDDGIDSVYIDMQERVTRIVILSKNKPKPLGFLITDEIRVMRLVVVRSFADGPEE